MKDYEAKSIFQRANVMDSSIFGWDMTDEDEAAKIRIAEVVGWNATQEQIADAIAQETGRSVAVVSRRGKTWIRGDHPDEDGITLNGRFEIVYQA